MARSHQVFIFISPPLRVKTSFFSLTQQAFACLSSEVASLISPGTAHTTSRTAAHFFPYMVTTSRLPLRLVYLRLVLPASLSLPLPLARQLRASHRQIDQPAPPMTSSAQPAEEEEESRLRVSSPLCLISPAGINPAGRILTLDSEWEE